jgi:hypothetical protein
MQCTIGRLSKMAKACGSSPGACLRADDLPNVETMCGLRGERADGFGALAYTSELIRSVLASFRDLPDF